MKALTPEKVKEQAHEMGLHMVEQSQEQQNEIKELIEAASVPGFDEDETRTLMTLLSLSDESFEILGPIFFAEFEKGFNDLNNQMLMVQVMNATGHHAEDVEEEYEAICQQIDESTAGHFSQAKRDFLKNLIGLIYNAVSNAEGISRRNIVIPIEKCHPDAKLPAYAHLTDAGMDVYALEDITIEPGETKLIPLGIKVALPLNYELQVRPKSGRCLKTKLRVANTPGTIDSGYRDEIAVIIENIDPPIRAIHTDFANSPNDPIPVGAIDFGQSYTIGKGEKFAQLVLSEVPKAIWNEVESVMGIGEDRKGGFGSTGLK